MHRDIPPAPSQSQREDFLFPPPPPSHTSRPSLQTSHRLSSSPLSIRPLFSSYLLVTRCLPSSSRQRSPSYFSLHCLTLRHLLTFGSLAGSAPRWLQLQFFFFFFFRANSSRKLALGPQKYSFPSSPSLAAKSVSRSVRLGDLKILFLLFFHCSNFITIQQIWGNFMIRDGSY